MAWLDPPPSPPPSQGKNENKEKDRDKRKRIKRISFSDRHSGSHSPAGRTIPQKEQDKTKPGILSLHTHTIEKHTNPQKAIQNTKNKQQKKQWCETRCEEEGKTHRTKKERKMGEIRERERGREKKKGEISSEISFFWGFPVFFLEFFFSRRSSKKEKEKKEVE